MRQDEVRQRRDAKATKARLLAAAKRCFAEHGYASVGIRDIAAAADVSYALVSRYFGSKAGLLEAVLRDSATIDPIIAVERSMFGENLARVLIEAVQGDEPMAMAILFISEPKAREAAARVVNERIVMPLAEWIGPPYAVERSRAITILGAGFVTHARQMLMLGEMQFLLPEQPIARWLGRDLQDIVDGADTWQVRRLRAEQG